MAQKKPSIRDYKFSDGLLKQLSDSTVLCVQRDATAFATRGVTAATLTSFNANITAFDNAPTDEEILGILLLATENKDTIAENVRIVLRTIRTMAENKFALNSALYRTFGFDGMNQLSDEQLYRLGKRVGRVANANLTALATEGLTAAIITNLNTLVASLDTAIDTQQDAINSRDVKTQDRIDKGNVVYKELIRLCNIGKDLYTASDPAKYNDYVVYNTPSSKPEAENTQPSV